jgi:RsiW-degrading membrane proteinase PrsW (M82 family)
MAGYLGLIVRAALGWLNLPGLLAALLILGVWLVFLRGLDVFEPEQPHALAITLGLGMAAGIVCAIPYDLVHLVLGPRFDESVSGSLVYCILVIGLIEETIKLLPLMAVIRWTGWVDEPVDVAIFGATSALGFAFVENLMYLDPDRLVSIHARAFSATVLHMALTTIAAYGLMRARSQARGRARTAGGILGWFAVAVLAHGLYDFLLTAPGAVALLRPAAVLILLGAALAFKNAVINGLSWSPFWTDGTLHRVLLRWRYLGIALSAIVLFEYWLLATRFGPTAATRGFPAVAMTSGVLIFILTAHLGVFEITRRRWLPLLSRRRPARSSAESRTPEAQSRPPSEPA